jgi:hypothetical protein
MVNHEQGEDDTYRFVYRLPVEAEVAHAQNACAAVVSHPNHRSEAHAHHPRPC